MTSLFRSEEMTLCQLFLQSESAYACVSELGELGLVEFRDSYLGKAFHSPKRRAQAKVCQSHCCKLNPDVNAFQRKFVNEVRRCDEMERKLRFLLKEIEKADIPMADTGENPDAPHPREMIDLEAQFEELENEMKDSNANFEALQRSFLELTELKHILRKTQAFFAEAEQHVQHQQTADGVATASEEMNLLGESELAATTAAGRLGFVAGVIARERVPAFERLLWRACRGNVFFKQAEIEEALEDPGTGDEVHKAVFIVFFQGDQLKMRVKKICEGFRATLYPCPESPSERREMAIGVMTRIEDLQTVLSQTQDHRHRLLQTMAKNINVWFIKDTPVFQAAQVLSNGFNEAYHSNVENYRVKKIKSIYHSMNMFNLDVTQKCLIAECWCPVADLDKIQLAIKRGTERSGSSVPSILNRMETKHEPPTFNRVNKFTSGFQAIVDAYGVANYQEVNPALFTIITFPFLFSVMFGDCGHGAIMFLFALWMVMNEKKLESYKEGGEMFETIFAGRYIVMMMGIFSVYSGFLYNDAFSKSINIFGSGWVEFGNNSLYSLHYLEQQEKKKVPMLMLDPKHVARDVPYYFGIDPAWQLATNKLNFLNSFKMKLSIIFGVFHMMFGVFLSLYNHKHFNKPLNILCEFIPQVLFLMCIFGYLVILIFYKWLAYNIHSKTMPSLLLSLIGMFLNFGKNIKDEELIFTGQQPVQTLLVIVAVLCVPWMLAVKPFYLRHQAKSKAGFREMKNIPSPVALNNTDGLSGDNGQQPNFEQEVVHNSDDQHLIKEEEDAEEEFDFGEVFVHQTIHTIEYCLGCISNTASYLRLWALSLAHAQLSEVLWNMVFKMAFKMSGVIGFVAVFALFASWAVMTIAILLVMEGLSAFLHTLRLHWVEFQNKFYTGLGHKFQPFSFKLILSGEIEI